MNLNTLQIALINNDSSGVRAVIDELDRRTENELFRQAGEHFGFITAEAGGRRVAYIPELGRIFGYSDPSGLRKLVERYALESYFLGGYGQNVRQLMLQSFGIHKFSANATFVTWSTFLVAGMVATTSAADRIKLYLLECERAARIGSGFLASEKLEREARQDSFRRAATIARIDGMKNPVLQRLALEEIGIDPVVIALPGNQPDLFNAAGK